MTMWLVLLTSFYLLHYHTDPWTGSVWWDSSVSQKFTPGWFFVCLRCLKRHQLEKQSLFVSRILFSGHSLKLPTGKYVHLKISDDNWNRILYTVTTYSIFNLYCHIYLCENLSVYVKIFISYYWFDLLVFNDIFLLLFINLAKERVISSQTTSPPFLYWVMFSLKKLQKRKST